MPRPRAPRARQCVKRTRPEWWAPAEILHRLQEGAYIGELCRLASEEMAAEGVTLAPSYLRSEVGKWAESASYGEQLTRALKIYYRDNKGRMVYSKVWHDEFILAMEATGGNPERAAEASGIGYGVVMAVLDKRNKCYDPEFHERFRIAEAERVAGIRENHFQIAESEPDIKTRVSVQKNLLATHAPTLHGTTAELHVTGKVEHDHEHEHTHRIAGGLAREVVMASQSRVKGLMAGRTNGGNGSLPMGTRGEMEAAEREGRVIDVTPIRERQEVSR